MGRSKGGVKFWGEGGGCVCDRGGTVWDGSKGVVEREGKHQVRGEWMGEGRGGGGFCIIGGTVLDDYRLWEP